MHKTSRSRNQSAQQPNFTKKVKRRGAAILQALDKIHHIAILGVKLIKPQLINELHLPKHS